MRKNWQKLLVSGLLAGSLVLPGLARAEEIPLDNFRPDSVTVSDKPEVVAPSLVTIVMVAAAVLMFGYMLWGGIDMITAGGEADKFRAGIAKIRYAIIGLLVVAASWAIFELVLQITFGTGSAGVELPTIGAPKGSGETPKDGGGRVRIPETPDRGVAL